jgi:hypothetical protein
LSQPPLTAFHREHSSATPLANPDSSILVLSFAAAGKPGFELPIGFLFSFQVLSAIARSRLSCSIQGIW